MHHSNLCDIEEIRRALSLMLKSGQVVELRALGTSYGTASEYFTDLDKLAEAAASISGKAKGVYITLNPVAPNIAAITQNRLTIPAKKNTTVNDKQILCRRHLGIDFDPIRPSEVSSNEAEHQAALERAKKCMTYLSGLGWPQPINADSGNGAHLVYAIDLPNDDASKTLIKNCFKALSLLFTDAVVQVDLQNFNAGRIWKLYGTLAAKGISTPDRPHRLSRILSHPDSLIPISVPLLEELAAKIPTNPENPANPTFRRRGGGKVNVAAWIEEHGVPIAFDAPWEKHHKWVLQQCPWNPDHTNKSAFIIQFANGGVMARCLHNSCQGKGWPELRDIYEPDWREKDHKDGGGSPHYERAENGIVWWKQTKDGITPVPLINFDAQIAKEITLDDGVEATRLFQIQAQVDSHSFTCSVPSSQFATMNWVTEQLGARAIVYPGSSVRDHARAAIQFLSEDIAEERIYTHSGWTIHDGQPIYLHGNGALGAKGVVDGIETKLPTCLQPFNLTLPQNRENAIKAVRASLEFLQLAPDSVTFPLYAALWRSVLSTCDFSVFLAGQTGLGKSELAALLLQHFGSGFTSRNLSASWTSTSNALEGLAFVAKDMLLVVDDFMPNGSQNDVARAHKEADRLLRAQGNNAGRGRMRADATLKPAKPPRGLILSTGEDVPRGSSLQSRLVIVELANGVDWQKLTNCQADAGAGLFAEAMAAFIVWLAVHYETLQAERPRQMEEYRTQATSQTQHKRTPHNIANLTYGLNTFLHFATKTQAITPEEQEELKRRGWKAFGEVAVAQSSHQASQDPVDRFLHLLGAALSTDKAYLAVDKGQKSEDEHRERIGWTVDEDGETLEMLQPDIAFATTQRMAQQQGEPLTITQPTLWKRMAERGLLARSDSGRNKYSWNRNGIGERVICLRAGIIRPAYTDNNRDFRDKTDFSFGFNAIEHPDSVQ